MLSREERFKRFAEDKFQLSWQKLTRYHAGEWEYDFAPLPSPPKERPYTPPREDPIEYLVEELKIIWAPRLIDVPGANAVTPASGKDTSKGASEKVKVTAEEAKSTPGKENNVCGLINSNCGAVADHS